MLICKSKQEMRRYVTDWRRDRQRIALVPTMGALHDGHMSLVAHARDWLESHGGGRLITSIFVNPTQFGPSEDLEKYPRDEENDLNLLRKNGVDAVFMPTVGDIYLSGAQTIVEATALSRILIGRLRPGHFRGVTTVVTKLFNITGCDAAVFGEKDYQQLTIIRQMVRDLDMPVEIIPVPTMREADGLAMSSRNRRLSATERTAATVLSRALDHAQMLVAQDVKLPAILREIRQILQSEPLGEVRSIDIRDAADLTRINHIDRPVVILLTVRFGDVLLIDQRVAHP